MLLNALEEIISSTMRDSDISKENGIFHSYLLETEHFEIRLIINKCNDFSGWSARVNQL